VSAIIGATVLLGTPPLFAQTAPASSATTSETVVKLDPFSVKADSDVGFVAASSLAGGRIATALKDTPVSYSVVTKEFLDAFNIVDIGEAANSPWGLTNGLATRRTRAMLWAGAAGSGSAA